MIWKSICFYILPKARLPHLCHFVPTYAKLLDFQQECSNLPKSAFHPIICAYKSNTYLKMAKITVKDTEVNVVKVNGENYICLTDMLRAKDGEFFITDRLRNRNTLEFIGIWEKVYNPDFNYSNSSLNFMRIRQNPEHRKTTD